MTLTIWSAFFNAKGGWQTRPAHWQTNPGKVQETREFLDHFYRCLSEVPQRSADAFVYREIDGLSTKEICKLLDISANNCWVLLYRARMLLRKCLELIGLGPAARRKFEMKHWMFRCQDVSQKVSQSLDTSLPLHHRMAVQFHLMMCRYCARFRSQLIMLRKICRLVDGDPSAQEPAATLSKESKERIKKALRSVP
jgi:hypothetical protein